MNRKRKKGDDTNSDPDKENTEGYLLVNLSGKVILIHTLLNIYSEYNRMKVER